MSQPVERLHVVVLVHEWQPEQLQAALDSLRSALQPLQRAGMQLRVSVLDNGDRQQPQRLQPLLAQLQAGAPGVDWQLQGGLPNQGYGSGHNLGIRASQAWSADWHLVLNPDVLLAPDALEQGLAWLRQQPRCALVSPACRGWHDEQPQHLARTAPSLLILLLRNLPRRWQQSGWVRRRLQQHCYTDAAPEQPLQDVDTQSGCFMLGPLAAFVSVGGFDTRYFMYFEDLDLSLRLRRAGWRIDRVPAVSIRHAGGQTARKGARHLRYFAVSALRFYLRHPAAALGRGLRAGQ